MIKQGECQKLSLKILEACQQVWPRVIAGLFNPCTGICSIPRLLLALVYMPNPSVYNAVPLKDSGRRGGLMVSALVSGASAPGSSPGRGHGVVFLGKTLYSRGAALHPGV